MRDRQMNILRVDDGRDAVKKIMGCRPDLVLLDLDLPGMEGTEVIREVRERGFEGEIIILSSRPEFEDARAVIQYGVSDFLVKPVDEARVQDVVRDVQEKADRRRERERSLRQYMEKARTMVLYDLLRGGESDPSVNYNELGLEADIYQVLIWESCKPGFRQSDLADKLAADSGGRDTSFECVSVHQKEVILLKGQSALEKFRLWKDSAWDSANLAYGEAVSDIREIGRSYSQCETLCRRRFFEKEHRSILSFEELPEEGGEVRIDPAMGETYSRRLFEDMRDEKPAELRRTLEELGEYLRRNNFEVLSVRYFLVDIFLQVKQHVTDTYGSGAGIPFERNAAVIKRIESESFLQGICDYLAGQFEKVMNHIRTKCRADREEERKYEDDNPQ